MVPFKQNCKLPGKDPLPWRLAIAALSLLMAVAVYCFVRDEAPEILPSVQLIDAGGAIHAALFGSAPSFFYTLALVLILGCFAGSRSGLLIHCLSWMVLAVLLELSQISMLSRPLSAWLAESTPAGVHSMLGAYWSRGVFDPLDLLAILVGGGAAGFVLLAGSPPRKRDVRGSR